MPTGEDAYKFLFMAKGGGSANKSFLFQATPSLLDACRMLELPEGEGADARHRGLPALSFGDRDRRHLGRDDLKTVKLASAHYLDALPTRGERQATPSAILRWSKRC